MKHELEIFKKFEEMMERFTREITEKDTNIEITPSINVSVDNKYEVIVNFSADVTFKKQ